MFCGVGATEGIQFENFLNQATLCASGFHGAIALSCSGGFGVAKLASFGIKSIITYQAGLSRYSRKPISATVRGAGGYRKGLP